MRELQAELPEQQFNIWIRPLQAVFDGRVLRLLAPNRFVVDWLQQHHMARILELVGSGIEVQLEVGAREAPISAVSVRVDRALVGERTEFGAAAISTHPHAQRFRESPAVELQSHDGRQESARRPAAHHPGLARARARGG